NRGGQLFRPKCESADLRCAVTVTDDCAVAPTRRAGTAREAHADAEDRGLALRGIARLAVVRRAGQAVHDLEAQIGVGRPAMRACEANYQVGALALEKFDRLEQVCHLL